MQIFANRFEEPRDKRRNQETKETKEATQCTKKSTNFGFHQVQSRNSRDNVGIAKIVFIRDYKRFLRLK